MIHEKIDLAKRLTGAEPQPITQNTGISIRRNFMKKYLASAAV